MVCHLNGFHLLLIASLMGFSAPAGAVDFTRFLSDSSALKVRVGASERLWVDDSWGNTYRLRVLAPASRASVVGLSVLTEAVGLPNTPEYPVMLREGEQGFPGSGAGRVMGLMRPPVLSKRFDPGQLSPGQRAEYFFHTLLGAIAGNPNPEVFFSHDAFVSGPFVPTGGAMPSVKSVLEKIPANILEKAGGGEKFLGIVNLYLSRIEKIEDEALSRAFLAEESRRRIKDARAETIAFLKSRGWDEQTLGLLQKAVNVPRPRIGIPKASLSSKAIPSLASEAPIDLLWSYYFEPSGELRAQAEEAWAKEMNVSARKSITRLAREASATAPRVYEVTPDLSWQHNAGGMDDLRQVSLNSKNAETLVVVPVNDAEAREISRIASQSGARVLALSGDLYPHGAKLDESLRDRIVEEARKHRIKRLIISELPEQKPGIEATFWERNLELITVDHHRYKHVDRTNPKSSLEQLSEILGYKLSPTAKIIAVRDRSFLAGLVDLGVPWETIREKNIEHIQAGMQDLDKFEAIDTAFGKLYVCKSCRGKAAEYQMALMDREAGKIPNILIIHDEGLVFYGRKEIQAILAKAIDPHRSQLQTDFSGGDACRAVFCGISGMNGNMKARVVGDIAENMKSSAILTPFELKYFLTNRLGDVLRMSDPQARRAELRRLRWASLAEVDRLALLKFAANARVGYDIAEYVEIARYSHDSRWRPLLEDWKTRFGQGDQRWERQLKSDIDRALNNITQGVATKGPCQAGYSKLTHF